MHVGCVSSEDASESSASAVSSHQGRMAHASSNFHGGPQTRNSRPGITCRSFFFSPVTITDIGKQSTFFRTSRASNQYHWVLLRLACCALPCSSSRKLPSCTWLSNFLWNSFDSGTQEQRKLNLECPEGFLCKRIPTQIVANTHTNIYVGLFSRKRAQTSNLRHTTAVDNRRRRSSLFISGQVGSVTQLNMCTGATAYVPQYH